VALGSTGIRIIEFRRSHLKQISAIERAAFGDGAYSQEMFLQLHQDCRDLFFVARCSGLIAGYIVTCAHAAKAEIVSIAVGPKFRNKGVGRALMLHTFRKLKARGVRTAELMVRSTNVESIRFYRSFGFVRTRKVAHYYEDGGDAWRMKKLL
jgi:ribosomal protein S18 acetylase RimI-like enzyme